MGIMMRFPEGKAKVFTMSYDDGIYQDYRLIDIMKKNNLKGTFNINAGILGAEDATEPYQRLSEKQVKELYIPAGHEVAMHTYTHPSLTDLPIELVTHEYLKDKEELEEIFGMIIRGSAYPNSRYNANVLHALKSCGISYARGGDQTGSFEMPVDWHQLMPTVRHTNPELMKYADDFIKLSPMNHHPCFMLYLMGHSYEFDNDNNWHVIEEFAEKIGGHDDIWYATNIEIFDYVHAFRSVRFNIAQTIAENPTNIDVWIKKHETTYKLEAGKTTHI